MNIEKLFSVELTLRIDWSEQDLFKHINNVSFFKYIQAARVNYWEEIGLNQYYSETNIGPMLASCQCDFKSPLYFPGSVKIQSRLEHLGTTSFILVHQLLNTENEVVANARDVVVLFDFNINAKCAIPQEIKLAIEKVNQNRI